MNDFNQNVYYERGSLVLLMKQIVDESTLTMFDIRNVELEELLNLLTEGQRNLFNEYYIKKKTIHSISEESDKPKYNIYLSLKRGRTRIIKELTKNEKGN